MTAAQRWVEWPNPANLAFALHDARDLIWSESEGNPLDALERALLDRLRAFAHKETGACFPSEERLARQLGCSLSTVKRCRRKLEGRGLVEVERARTPGAAKNDPNRYTLRFERLQAWVEAGAGPANEVAPPKASKCPAKAPPAAPGQGVNLTSCPAPVAGGQVAQSRGSDCSGQGVNLTPDPLSETLKETLRERESARAGALASLAQLAQGLGAESVPPPPAAPPMPAPEPAPRLVLCPPPVEPAPSPPPATSSRPESGPGAEPLETGGTPESRAVAALWAAWCADHRAVYARPEDAPKRDDDALRRLLTAESEKHGAGSLELAARVPLCAAVLRAWLRRAGGNGFLKDRKHALHCLRSEKSLDTLFSEALSAEKDASEKQAKSAFFAGAMAEVRAESRPQTDEDRAVGLAHLAEAAALLGLAPSSPPPSTRPVQRRLGPADLGSSTYRRAAEFWGPALNSVGAALASPPARRPSAPPAPSERPSAPTPLLGPPGPVKGNLEPPPGYALLVGAAE